MRYNVCLFSVDSNEMFAEYQKECSIIDKAKSIYDNYRKEGFNGESILAYIQGGEYENILPLLKLRKKTDWRYGEDLGLGEANRKKYLKYKFLGKTHTCNL